MKRVSPVAQTVKNLPAMWETPVPSLGLEDLLEEGVAPHSSIPAWRIPWPEEPGGLQSRGSHRVGHDRVTNTLLNCTDSSAPGCMQKCVDVTEFEMLAVVGLLRERCSALQSGAGAEHHACTCLARTPPPPRYRTLQSSPAHDRSRRAILYSQMALLSILQSKSKASCASEPNLVSRLQATSGRRTLLGDQL